MEQSEHKAGVSEKQYASRVVVLLTACANINVHVDTPTSAGDRVEQYRRALEMWVRARGIHRLVFCESSGADLSVLQEVARLNPSPVRVEFLSYRSAVFDPALGKGFGEMDIIRHAMGASKFLAGADLIAKVTGRIFVRNIKRLSELVTAGPRASVYCDLRKDLREADSRVFFATSRFMRDYLLPRGHLVDDSRGVFLEHILARAVHAALADGERWAPLPLAHWMHGYSGTANQRIGNELFRQIRRESFRAFKNACLRR